MLEIKTDLDHELRLKEELIRVEEGMLRVVSQEKTRLEIPVKQIRKVFVEEGLGIGRLIIKTKNGTELEVAYFTKERVDSFKKFARVMNAYTLKGREVKISFEEKKYTPKGRISTVMWLYGFATYYRKPLLIGTILAVFAIIVSLVPPYLLKVLIDSVLLSTTPSTLLFEQLTLILVLSYAVATLLSALRSYYLNLAGNKILVEMRSRLFEKSVNLPSSFIDNMSSGRILSRLISDVGNTQWLMTFGLPTLITNTLTIVGIAVILFSIFPTLAIFVLLPIPFIVLIIANYRSKSGNIYHKNYRRSADLISDVADVIPNYLVVKASGNEGFESREFDKLLDVYNESQMEVVLLNLHRWPLVSFLTVLATVVIWWVGGNLVLIGSIQLGIVTAFLAYMAMFYAPINQLGDIIPFVQQSITSGERIIEIFEVKEVVKNKKNAKKPNLAGEIDFNNVWFGYEPLLPVVKEVSIKIKNGQRTALVGKSGSGKTTLTKLLLRMYDVDEGNLKINGMDIRDMDLNYLRSRMAYAPQDAIFFDESAAYNVSYYSGGNAKQSDIIAACTATGIHEKIMEMPLGYDTSVGERGLSLSGGQKQMLSLARVIITQPDIMLLDEVTSSLDVVNTQIVDQTILNLTKGKTTVWITHDIDEVMCCENVVVMEKGRVVEAGNPKRLFAKKGKLYSIFRHKTLGRSKLRASGKGRARLDDYIKGFLVDEKKVKIEMGSRGSLVTLHYSGLRARDLVPRKPFPISKPEFIIFYNSEGDDVVAIEDMTKLKQESLKALDHALELNSFSPRVKQIKHIAITGDGLEWELVTAKGNMKVVTVTRRNIIIMKGRVVLIDKYNTPYEIGLGNLDSASLKRLNNTI